MVLVRPTRRDAGVSMLIVALMMVTLIVFVSLAVDIGVTASTRRDRQNLSDSSALAGGIELQSTAADKNDRARTVAREYAEDHLNTTATSVNCASVSVASAPGVTDCYVVDGVEIGITSPFGGDDTRVRVETCERTVTFFATVIGTEGLRVCTDAVAEAASAIVSSSAGPAIHALGADDKKAFEHTGNATVVVTKGDIVVNSDGDGGGESINVDGVGGVTMVDGDVFMNSAGMCVGPPQCGQPTGIQYPNGNQLIPLAQPNSVFDDPYASSVVVTNPPTLAEFDPVDRFSLGGDFVFQGPDWAGSEDNPSCPNGSSTMPAGYYGQKVTIKGCVTLEPGVFRFQGAVISDAVVSGTGVFLFNESDDKRVTFAKSAVEITAPTPATIASMPAGPMRTLTSRFDGFLYYQPAGNTNLFIPTSDAYVRFGGIVYLPDGEFEINGANAQGARFGDATLGASIVSRTFKIKSDGTLHITRFEGTGGSPVSEPFVRLAE